MRQKPRASYTQTPEIPSGLTGIRLCNDYLEYNKFPIKCSSL